MIWGYLQEFWNAITGVLDYPIEFFQSIGNAVAGAIGNLFEFFIHNITDIFVFAGWFFSNFRNFFGNVLLPLRYVYTFLQEFINTAFVSPNTSAKEIWFFGSDIMAIFNVIPYWATLCAVLGICLIIIIGFAIVKHFTKI